MQNINEKSTKASIIEAAQELISIQETELNTQAKSLATLREEKLVLIGLSTLFFTIMILF
tara:strand:+ start:988 stop:1167 length:180 start_codon:yes stop_codon:yes gene_type:complete